MATIHQRCPKAVSLQTATFGHSCNAFASEALRLNEAVRVDVHGYAHARREFEGGEPVAQDGLQVA